MWISRLQLTPRLKDVPRRVTPTLNLGVVFSCHFRASCGDADSVAVVGCRACSVVGPRVQGTQGTLWWLFAVRRGILASVLCLVVSEFEEICKMQPLICLVGMSRRTNGGPEHLGGHTRM